MSAELNIKQKVGRVGGVVILTTAAAYGFLPGETKASPPEQGVEQIQEEDPLIIVATPGSEPYETPYDALSTEYFNATRASIVRGRQLLGEYAVSQGLATQQNLEDYFNRDILYFIPGQSTPNGDVPVTPVPPVDGQHVPVFMVDQANRFGFFVPGREIQPGERNGFVAPFEGIDDFGNPQDFRWSFTEDGKVQGQNLANNVLIIGDGNEQAGFVAWIPGEAPEAAWYANLSQSEMAEIAINSQRLNWEGSPIPFNRIDIQQQANPIFTDISLYGVVLERPHLESVPVTTIDGQNTNIEAFVAPYQIQDNFGNYHILNIIVGLSDENDVMGRSILRNHSESVNHSYNNIPILELNDLLSPNTQHIVRLGVLSPGQRKGAIAYAQSVLDQYPDQRDLIYDRVSYVLTYTEDTFAFLDRIKNGQPVEQTPAYSPGGPWDINTE